MIPLTVSPTENRLDGRVDISLKVEECWRGLVVGQIPCSQKSLVEDRIHDLSMTSKNTLLDSTDFDQPLGPCDRRDRHDRDHMRRHVVESTTDDWRAASGRVDEQRAVVGAELQEHEKWGITKSHD